MKIYRQPLLTVLVIFATAYVLTIVGCAKSSDGKDLATPVDASPNEGSGDGGGSALQPVDIKTMRECSAAEFKILKDWSDTLADASDSIARISPNKKDYDLAAGNLAISAIKKCDVAQAYHATQPCKRTSVQAIGKVVKGYDSFRIRERCGVADRYLTKYGKRPAPNQAAAPSVPKSPSVSPRPVPQTPVAIEPAVGGLPQCSADEFTKIKTWKTALDITNKNISAMNGVLVFNQNTINAATSTTQLCEALITYHEAKPCVREKAYTGQTLREQCTPARTYHYDFAQRKDSLISLNARLYFDTSVISNKSFRTGFGENSTFGNCSVSNESSDTITYTGQPALVKEARVYTDSAIEEGRNMFVFKTAEGLKFECYGLEYSSILTSKTEVVRLLSNKQTKISLRYELN